MSRLYTVYQRKSFHQTLCVVDCQPSTGYTSYRSFNILQLTGVYALICSVHIGYEQPSTSGVHQVFGPVQCVQYSTVLEPGDSGRREGIGMREAAEESYTSHGYR